MDTIYIEVGYPRELLIAVRTGRPGYDLSYEIYTVEYGRDLLGRIEKSKEFVILEPGDLPDQVLTDFDFKRRYAGRVERAFVHMVREKIELRNDIECIEKKEKHG